MEQNIDPLTRLRDFSSILMQLCRMQADGEIRDWRIQSELSTHRNQCDVTIVMGEAGGERHKTLQIGESLPRGRVSPLEIQAAICDLLTDAIDELSRARHGPPTCPNSPTA